MTSLDWRPTATLEHLRQRATVLSEIRAFFAARDVLEVETPLLTSTTVTDPHIESIKCAVTVRATDESWYLQTSPEYFMKRMLAAGSGPIFQICKSFRNNEIGRHHCPEFSMVEWYRIDFDHNDLMDEVDELLNKILSLPTAQRLPYGELFAHYVGVDPHTATLSSLEERVTALDIGIDFADAERDFFLDLLWSHLVQPQLGFDRPVFVYDFPVCQAALGRIREGNPRVAERFEVFIEGMEIGNAYHEELNPQALQKRFENDLADRLNRGLPSIEIDPYLLAAQREGLPPCAGISIGIDRLIMVRTGTKKIEQTLSFAPWLFE